MYEASIIMIIQRFVTSVLHSRTEYAKRIRNGARCGKFFGSPASPAFQSDGVLLAILTLVGRRSWFRIIRRRHLILRILAGFWIMHVENLSGYQIHLDSTPFHFL